MLLRPPVWEGGCCCCSGGEIQSKGYDLKLNENRLKWKASTYFFASVEHAELAWSGISKDLSSPKLAFP